MKPRSRSASRIPSERADSLAGSPDTRYPIRGTFFGCCAWTREAVVRKKVAIRRMAVLLFIIPPRKGVRVIFVLFPVVLLVEVLISAPLKFYLGVLLAPKLQLKKNGSSPYRVGNFRIISDLLKHAGEDLKT